MTVNVWDLYRYRATVREWIDGDTFKADVDLGCRVHWFGSVRCAGYNAPEKTGSTRDAGHASWEYIKALLPSGQVLYLDSVMFQPTQTDSFGRMLAMVWTTGGISLADHMIDTGYGAPA